VRKQLAAIVFISILAFNWLGYRYVFNYLEEKQDHRFETKLDKNNFDEDDLISIKTPLPLPYAIQTEEFERWSGEIEVGGILYKYVKRRFVDNMVEYLCIPNHEGTMIKNAKEEFFRLAHDLQTNNDNHKQDPGKKSYKNPLTEFFEEISSQQPDSYLSANAHYSVYLFYLPETTITVKEQPPELA
jgi:hypothetical protein